MDGAVLPRITREMVEALEREIQKLPQVECPVRHFFADGVHGQEMTIPAGVVLTGAVHKREGICILSKGRLMVTTPDGMKLIEAPYTFVSGPGEKRAGFALTESVFTTLHRTDATDPDAAVEDETESKADELLGGKNNVQLKMNRRLQEGDKTELLK